MRVLPLTAELDAASFGGKGAQLSAATRAQLPVPAGFALSTEALSALVAGDAAVVEQVGALVAQLGGRCCARSSAVGEDGASASFAGQHLSVLNLTNPASLIDALLRVHASAHAPAALAYRAKRGIEAKVQMAAVVQQLAPASVAGVLFTQHPVTQAREYVIEAGYGLGEVVVSGMITPDHYRLGLDGTLLETRLGDKDLALEWAQEGGTREVALTPQQAARSCLTKAQLLQLCELARRCQAHFGRDLDLEWAFAAENLYLLQVRPISTTRGAAS